MCAYSLRHPQVKSGCNSLTRRPTIGCWAYFLRLGSENCYQRSIIRKVLYTDGAKYAADEGGAYWLLDEIAILRHTAKMSPLNIFRCSGSPSPRTTQRRWPATTAIASSSSARKSSTRLSDRGNHVVFANNTSTCRASTGRSCPAPAVTGSANFPSETP